MRNLATAAAPAPALSTAPILKVAGLNAWYGESVLMDQPFVKDSAQIVRDVILAVNSRTGENISVARFARFVVGEAEATSGS